jgi:hypothetical protein
MLNSTRENTALGFINWRKNKRNLKRAFASSTTHRGGIIGAKKTLGLVAKDKSLDDKGLRDNRLYLRNLVNWL